MELEEALVSPLGSILGSQTALTLWVSFGVGHRRLTTRRQVAQAATVAGVHVPLLLRFRRAVLAVEPLFLAPPFVLLVYVSSLLPFSIYPA